MQKTRLGQVLMASAVVLGAALPAWSAGSITFTLNGKPVMAVPVDQLGLVTATVNSGGQPFRSIYTGQWGGIDQSLDMRTRIIGKGGSVPDPDSGKWEVANLSMTSLDSTWGGKASLSASLHKGAREMDFESAGTDNDIAFTAVYYRKVKTGKTLWQKNSWVEETRWDRLGPVLASTVLKILPPAAASSLNLNVVNGAQARYAETLDSMARFVLPKDSTGTEKVTRDGSKILDVTAAGQPKRYRWGWDGATDYVYAEIPVKVKFHAAIQIKMDGLPVPRSAVADFDCDGMVQARCATGTSNWEARSLELAADVGKTARTADGKSPQQVLSSVAFDPMKALQSPDGAANLLRGLGF
jgi:hypothetical protein